MILDPSTHAPHLPPTSTSLIALKDVSRSFLSGIDVVRAVQDVQLDVEAGEFVCVLGASGSGKTTLLNLIAGLDRPDLGSIRIDNQEIVGRSEAELTDLRLREIGVVFQDHNLIEEFTAVENVALPLEVTGNRTATALALAKRELARVDMTTLCDRFPRQLSGGQKQRVGIARALAGERRILLADEPTGSLDSNNSRDLFQVFRTLCDQGACAVLATHDPIATPFADSVYTMTDGQLVRTS